MKGFIAAALVALAVGAQGITLGHARRAHDHHLARQRAIERGNAKTEVKGRDASADSIPKIERRIVMDKRALEIVYETVYVNQFGNPIPAPTTTKDAEYGKIVQQNTEVQAPTSATIAASSTAAAEALVKKPETSTSSTLVPQPKPTTTSTAAAPVSTPVDTGGSDDGLGEFPDGVVSCSSFPSKYGAVPLNYLGLGGYSGIQLGNDAVKDCNQEGALCSYACKPGYQKAQWPDVQPSDGQSRGGLLCKGGKLYKTRTGSNSLCSKGVGSAVLINKLNKNVAVCRTDYPGSENMVIPFDSQPGTTMPLTVPKSETDYKWQGQSTSAQYYVNPAGIPYQEGCQWNEPDGGKGNWSPTIFGAGQTGGISWLSISQNSLNSGPNNFNVKIVAQNGAAMNGECIYENGAFSTNSGCTVAVTSGVAAFVFY